MKLTTLSLVSALCSATVNQLAIGKPGYYETVSIGVPYTIKWNAGNGIPRVNLILKSGKATNLDTEATIAKNIDNTGEYVWSAPADTRRSFPLTLAVQSVDHPSVINYSPFFVVLDPGHWFSSSDFDSLISSVNNVPSWSNTGKGKTAPVIGSTSKVPGNLDSTPLSPNVSFELTQKSFIAQTFSVSRHESVAPNTSVSVTSRKVRPHTLVTAPLNFSPLSLHIPQHVTNATSTNAGYSLFVPFGTKAVSTIHSETFRTERAEKTPTTTKSLKTFKVTIKELHPNSTTSEEFSANIQQASEDFDDFLPSFISDTVHGLVANDSLSSSRNTVHSISVTRIKSDPVKGDHIKSDTSLSNNAVRKNAPFRLLPILFYLL